MDLSLATGVVGIVGPNGAGKTTLLSLAATIRPVQQGKVEVAGYDVSNTTGRDAARRALGFLPQRFDLSGSMRVVDTVAYAAWASGIDQADCYSHAYAALRTVELAERANDRVRRLSGGQRQRLGIAAATAHQPHILLLDEPTVGLDPSQRIKIRRYLSEISARRCVMISTHMIEDVAHLCDRIVVLNEGMVVFDGSPTRLAELGEDATAAPFASPLERAYEALLFADEGQ